MLREANVLSADIERRLHNLENANSHPKTDAESRPGVARNATTRIDDMMHQAMAEEVGATDRDTTAVKENNPSATLRPVKPGDASSKNPVADLSRNRNRVDSASSWQFWSASPASPTTSGSSSVLEEDVRVATATAKPRTASSNTKRRGLDNLFQSSTQSSSYFIGGVNKTVKKPLMSVFCFGSPGKQFHFTCNARPTAPICVQTLGGSLSGRVGRTPARGSCSADAISSPPTLRA